LQFLYRSVFPTFTSTDATLRNECRCRYAAFTSEFGYGKGKVVLVLNEASRHEDVRVSVG